MAPLGELQGSILVLGGRASGKSAFAEQLIGAADAVYVATAEAGDAEMRARIDAHRARRGQNWTTIEEPLELTGALRAGAGAPMLVDCLTIWLANLMHQGRDLELEITYLCQALGDASFPVVLVSNDVGGGIVPENALARAFSDASGRMNAVVAAAADQVYLVTAGLPQKLK
ncbi:MAG: bifunctional adenosylcobinamide kinase/adenosylcobinamide-phosphate guanylyltransferase [Rhodospirillaceae bacterium]|jgi:adenosylcobinamide kinase/adenosylcobinamide-phosphate guanylyltransferase|nr:bifunctional adenosylcobinamide kinase/adenosylcobinamide-phosphate guanylyltransferase [Rhodospirillaceae bacterium]MBT3884660.1 bifunctional adenosylcobinamide kinase/adenosylcobinamide-phosphate guanylyltransferase [Rhodospirillaceae bacterium]MBT4115008.1 bifunctional adenosylcobinamide kinase/adenosylcobinamide-phosphate guanylyltransferase [Rhodospirillaceae bacterium]MBT4671400.1 bifunctional adenosylcobinamide kinase/adenosylcobinamide-phosphate guanylyltransferase [Rhodospirillaceae 